MHPTRNQQLAIRAMLNTLIGPRAFDRLCLGIQVDRIDDVFCTCSCQTRTAPQKSKPTIPTIWPPQPNMFSANPSKW
jgi:hypothetical protein